MDQPFDLRSLSGLSREEAACRIAEEGYNELPSSRGRTVFAIAYDVIREPMFLLLVTGGVLYLFLGELQEALMMLGFVFVVMGITLYQERKTERALDALRDLSSPRALVIRDGGEQRIAGRDVVRDDILVVREGDRVPADAVLLDCINLAVDESLLTGESAPVRKTAAVGLPEPVSPGGDDLPFVYSGTLVVQGQGAARVTATGLRTEIGKIGQALQTMAPERTPLQKETGVIVRKLALLGLGLCFIVFVAYGLTRGNWLWPSCRRSFRSF
jgi:Ca2+-transporting ATPase